MKTRILTLLVLLTSVPCFAQPDTVDVSQADMLLITHTSLRTPNWVPGMQGAWESALLSQKESQGIDVALYAISDGVPDDTIRAYVQAHGQNLKYVFIIGDFNHPDIDPDSPTWYNSSSSLQRFVPFYGVLQTSDTTLCCVNYPVENDLGYVNGLDNVSVGRIPACTRDQINIYLDKVGEYLGLSNPAWARKNLLAIDDVYHNWVQLPEVEVHYWTSQLLGLEPANWSFDTLFGADYSNYSVRADTFVGRVNSGYGLITSFGGASHMDELNFFFDDTCSTCSMDNFENAGEYPLLLGLNCSIGAVQRPTYIETDVIPWHYIYDVNILEWLLFKADGGIIGALAPSGMTFCRGDYLIAKKAVEAITEGNIRTFGGLWKSVLDIRNDQDFSEAYPDWQIDNLILLGDPSLRYPTAVVPSGHWTPDISPVVITDSLHIVNGDSLTIDAGVQVLFDQGACLVVDPGAKLIVNGTSSQHVVFDRKDSGETWKGIYVNGSQADMEWADFDHATPYNIHTSAPAGSGTPVTIDHCYFNGGSQQTGGVVLLLWDSPTLVQKVTNSTVENVPNGNALYSYNCKVRFEGDTLRGCSYINSYIQKTLGSFKSCYFQGRVSNYSVLFATATCTPDFKCCTFKDLAPTSGSFKTSIFCGSGTAPTFGGEGFINGVSNVTNDSSAYLFVIQGNSVLPVIDNTSPPGNGGCNDWTQRKSSGKFIEWRDRTTAASYKCEGQYWSPTPADNLFYPTGAFDYTPYQASAWTECGGADENGSLRFVGGSGGRREGQGGAGLDDAGDDYAAALVLESQEEYAQAQALFHEVATSSTDPDLRWNAATHVVITEAYLDNGEPWVPELLDSLVTSDNTYGSYVYGNRVLSCYRLNQREYESAIDVCTDLLNSGLTFTDSIYVAIDLVGIEMAAGLIDIDGHLDAAGSGIPAGLQVTSLAQGLRLEDDLLRAMGGGQNGSDVVVPREYRLYQNYPNPFNPATELRFDLPEAVPVQLKIFNLLGQEVATLVNEVRPAGAYRLTWDSKSANGIEVTSGVYIYQIKAGKFVDSKKMMLIR